jgi:WD40 repeat protein
VINVAHDGTHIISASYDCTVRVWVRTDVGDDYVCAHVFTIDQNRVLAAVLSTGTHLISRDNRNVCAWDVRTGNMAYGLIGVGNQLCVDMLLTPNGAKLVTANAKDICVRRAFDAHVLGVAAWPAVRGDYIRRISLVPNHDDLLVTISNDRVDLWDVNVGAACLHFICGRAHSCS